MYRTYLFSSAAAATLMLASTAGLHAQEAQSIELDTINIEGQQGKTTGAQYGDDAPATATQEQTVLTTRADRQELDRRQISDPTDINKITPGVSFSETSRGFNVRGLSNQRVLTTIDGIPLPYLDDGARGADPGTGATSGSAGGPASVDFDSLSAIDVVKGSDSSVFGSGMLGGGIRFRTLEPEDLLKVGENFGGVTKFGFDSRDDSWRVDQALAARIDKTFFMVQGGYRNGHEMENMGTNPGPGSTRTIKNPADYDQENLLVKLRHYVDGGHMIGFTGERFSREGDINSLTTNVPGFGTSSLFQPGTARTEETNKRHRASLDYRYDGGGWLDLAEATVFWQRQELADKFTGVRVSAPAGDYLRNNMREYDIYGVNGSALKIIDTGSAEHRVSFGAQVYGSDSHQYSGGQDNCGAGPWPDTVIPMPPPLPPMVIPHNCNFLHSNQSDMPDVNGLTAAAFVQDEIALLDDTVRVTPGMRFDWYRQSPELTDAYARNQNYINSGLPDESSDGAISPKLRVEADATDNVTLFAQWAQGFRAPTVNELYLTYGGVGTYLRIGNDQLDAETSNGFDLGLLVGDSVKGGSVKVFYNRYKNFIDSIALDGTDPDVAAYLASLGYNASDYMMGITQYRNRANVHIYGAELEAHYKHESGWHGWGQFGAYVGEDMDLDVGLNTIPAAKVVLGVGYEQASWGADLILTAAASRNFTPGTPATTPAPGSDLENAQSATPSYALLDLTAWWSPAAVEGLTIRAGIFNITDELYYEDALDITASNKQYFTQPGRNFRVSATYQF